MQDKFRSFWNNFKQAPLLICLLVTVVPFVAYMVHSQAAAGEVVADGNGIAPGAESASSGVVSEEQPSQSGTASEQSSLGAGDSGDGQAGPDSGDESTASASDAGSDGSMKKGNSLWETIPAEEAATEAVTIDPALQVIPDGVNNPVMQAVDYGNVNTAYRAPAGTVFEHDRSGIFAPDGTYYYLQSVPDDSYFSDALFIGDSRMSGFGGYSSLKDISTFWAKESMSVFNIYNDSVNLVSQGNDLGRMSLDDVLDQKQYGKIYISMGINEIGMPYTTTYVDRYRTILTDIRNRQPDAIIYITGIMHVSQSVSSTDAVTNNPNIVERNEAVVSLTNGRDIFYLDMDPAVCDSNGDLIADLTGDGIHLKASAYEKWADFLRQNAIVKEQNGSSNQAGETDADATETGTSESASGEMNTEESNSTYTDQSDNTSAEQNAASAD